MERNDSKGQNLDLESVHSDMDSLNDRNRHSVDQVYKNWAGTRRLHRDRVAHEVTRNCRVACIDGMDLETATFDAK